MKIETPYLLFLGEAADRTLAKTAVGIHYWRPENCLAQQRLAACKTDLGLPDMTAAEAAARGAKTLVIGVAPAGGRMPASWHPVLYDALEAGLDIASGLHDRLDSVPGLADAAARLGRALIDARKPQSEFAVGNGRKRRGKRLLAVGTDCSVGKMYTTLAIEKEITGRGMTADFRATGQTGILITGGGIPVDALVADFISGATEQLSPDNDADHWDIIEGQGSLYHPAYAGVTLGLIHGSQPDALVLCHEYGREIIFGTEDYKTPTFDDCFETYLRAARLTNPEAQFVGISLNTSSLAEEEALRALAQIERETGLPAVDPVRTGVAKIVDRMERTYG